MYLTAGVLLAFVATVLSAPSEGKHLTISLKKHQTGLQAHKGAKDIPLDDFAGWVYYAEVQVGTPGQKLNLLFDTTTADLLVTSSKICKEKPDFCKNHKVYNERKSKTYKKIGKKWSTDFGLFEGSGYTSNDTVNVGGLQVKNQMFGEATEVLLPVGAPFDGVLGLAFSSVRKVQSNSVFVNMIEQKVVSQPVFAFKLNQWWEVSAAELVLGGVNPKHYTGQFTYTPVTQQSFWFINIDGLSIKSDKIVGQYPATVEINNFMMYGPIAFMDKINKALGGERQWDGSYKLDCTKLKTLPDITFTISGKSFPLTYEEYTTKRKPEKEVICYSLFFGVDDLKYFILGNTFISKYYTVFDVGQNRVGFALRRRD